MAKAGKQKPKAKTKHTFSHVDRKANLDRLAVEDFDLVIIGGGITGAGVARDATSRGMKVALVEAGDFAQGTSSRSSKLIHGGIRYLENLEFGLVFEALSERRLLFEIAPNLVHPLRFVLPLYKGGRVGMFKMGMGMWLYDALSMFEAPELHERLSPEESLERLPLLQRRELLGSYVYSDAYMDDDRLVHETLRPAAAMGAVCVNYLAAEDAGMIDGKVRSIGCLDRLTGKKIRIRGRHFVSTVGPWTDMVGSHLLGQWRKVLRPSKGIHLTFDRKRLQMNQAVVMAAEKRIVFGIPRHEMTIIGTTDTDFQGDPDDVAADSDDVHYLLGVAERYFPGAKLTPADIISTYAGVRPLVDDGAATESKTSREHLILHDPRNVTFVAGGKYTTYRLMAEQTVEAALKAFPIEDQVRFSRSDTKRPLNDKATEAKMDASLLEASRWSKEFGMDQGVVEFLIGRHGEEALDLLGMLDSSHADRNMDERLWLLEARHSIQHTMCLNMVDFYFRRAPLFLARKDHGLGLADFLSTVFAQDLGWSEVTRQAEVAKLKAKMQKELAWKQSFGISPSSF
jgi:glycerol-3-phosphate dehydrogenase